MTRSALQEAMARWAALMGESCVLGANEASAQYACGSQRGIAAALRPRTPDGIQEIVRIAAHHRIPLHPISTGRNWGYGGAIPPADHCVLLDLSGLNRIIEIDADLGTATVEPGVTQGQLHAYLQARNLPFMVPTTGAGPSVSLVGNALERGYGITPHADHFSAVMGLEAVLPDGSMYCSRLSALGGTRIDRGYKWGIGPYLDGLFSQSNLGVVTQMTIALAQRPAHIEAFYIFLKDNSRLAPALQVLRGLLRSMGGLLGGVNVLNGYRLASMTCDYPTNVLERGTPLQAKELADLLRNNRLGSYLIVGSVYGEPSVARAAVAAVLQHFASCSSRRVRLTRSRAEWLAKLARFFPRTVKALGFGQDQAARMISALNLIEGIPDDVALRLPYWKSGAALPSDLTQALQNGERGLIWYAPLVPLTTDAVQAFEAMVSRVCLAHGFEPLITLTSLSDRCFDSSVPLLFDGRDPADHARAQQCFDALFSEGRKLGYVPYRMGAQTFDRLDAQNDPALTLARHIKQTLDPHGILSPGRYNL